jgi:hypothetical protein
MGEQLTAEVLERWELHGGHWRVAELLRDHVTVELCTCYGEPVDRVWSTDPELIARLRDAPSPQR